MRRERRQWCWVVALALAAGCGPRLTAEEAARRVLAEEPAFRQTLEQKSALDVQIAGVQRELFAKKSEVELQIKALQQEYRAAKRQADAQVQALVSQLDPLREQVRLDITLTDNQLKAQQAEVGSLRRSIAQLRISLKTSGGVAPEQAARVDRNERLASLTAQLGEHQAQVKALQDRRDLLRLKLQLLRQ